MAMRVRYTVVNGEVIAEKRSGVRKLYVPDPLGSTVALLDSTQTQTDTFSYWPYGEERSRTGTTATPFRFVGGAGYYRDSASRVYVRARDMDRRWGRWSTPELALPFWRALVARLPAPRGESYGLVLAKAAAAGYQYCNVNPLGKTDPMGLFPGAPSSPRGPSAPPGPLPLPFGGAYGNWCGPLRWGPAPPIDCIDASCKRHDVCLATWREFCTPFRRYECDKALCDEALRCLATGCGPVFSVSAAVCRFVAGQVAALMCGPGTIPVPYVPGGLPYPF